MNLYVKRSNLTSFPLLVLRSHLIGGFIFLSSCQFAPVVPAIQKSNIDAHFQYRQKQMQKETSVQVRTYRNIVAPTLSSHCKWFPSDSRYAELAQKKCGAVRGGMMAFSRFLYEEDASRMGYSYINNNNHIEFVDFPDECSL
jgi:putative component of membrane protein insertase Oxa1/YidC/SpoIIIJ protein YidD